MYEKQRHGTESELLAEYYFVNIGCIVLKPINDFNEYGFVIDCNGALYKVQVKTIYFDNSKNRWLGSCVTSHIKVDYALFVCKEHNCVYLVPIDKIVGRRSITFYPDSKPESVNSRYEDFEQYKFPLM